MPLWEEKLPHNDTGLSWEDLSPGERRVLMAWARNYHAGRRMLCWTAHAVVALGFLAAGIATIITALQSVINFRAP